MKDSWQKFYKNSANFLRRHSLDLASPHGSLPGNESSFISAAGFISSQSDLLIKGLLARVLINDSPPDWLIDWLDPKLDNSGFISCRTLQQFQWLSMPLLVFSKKNIGHLLWIMVGVKENLPTEPEINFIGLTENEFAESTQEELKNIRQQHRALKTRSSLAVWALNFSEKNQPVPVSGRSLGLPFALALNFIDKKIKWPQGLYATGALQGNQLIAVDGLAEKYQAVPEKYSGRKYQFLYPASCPSWPGINNQECIAVNDLQEAGLFADWFSEGYSGDYHLWQKCLSSPEYFLNNYQQLPVPMLKNALAANQYPITLKKVVDNYQLWSKLVATLDNSRKDNEYGPLLLSIIPMDEVDQLAEKSAPFARLAFKWCSLAVTIVNHQGKTEEARHWYDKAVDLAEFADQKELSRLENRYGIIHQRHNFYDFRPVLPKQFAAMVEKRRQRIGDDTDYALASFYGSIAQNFAFCGPAYLQKTINAAQQAIKYFADDTEKRRQYNYLAYAFLDKPDFRQSWHYISKYLDISADTAINDFIRDIELTCSATYGILSEKDSPFVLALLCRFFADIPEQSPVIWSKFKPLLAEIIKYDRQTHPFQLTLVNLGRLACGAEDKDNACRAWQTSVNICRQSKDTTIQPMALLGAAYLLQEDMAQPETIAAVSDLLTSPGITKMNQKHFQLLLTLRPKDALNLVAESPRQFFPFNYR